jgi:hypothetical protein
MSAEQLQQIQPLIQSNPELKQQLINYLTVYRILNIAPFVVIFLLLVIFSIYVVSDNPHRLLDKLLFTLIITTIIISMIIYIAIPFIAPDVYLYLQTK